LRSSLFLVGALLALLAFALSGAAAAQSAGSPTISVTSQYTVGIYGFGIVNETVTFNNNSTSPVQVPTLQMGFPSAVASKVFGGYVLNGSGFSASTSAPNGIIAYTVSPSSAALQGGARASFSLRFALANVMNSSKLLVVQYPSLSAKVDTLKSTIVMPSSTYLSPIPSGYTAAGTSYSRTWSEISATSPLVMLNGTVQSGTSSLYPIHVFSAQRTITTTSNGIPEVQESISLKNVGGVAISSLQIAPLSTALTQVTVIPTGTPPLVNPTVVTLTGGAIDLTKAPFGNVLAEGTNLTLTYVYNLPSSLYTVSGGVVHVHIPETPPIAAAVDTYTITLSLPTGMKATQSAPLTILEATPLTQGKASFAYSITLGFAADRAVPVASAVFFVVLIGLYLARPKSEEVEEEEGTVSEQAADMIKAFEEKTDLIESMLEEIAAEDPNNLNKGYFDEQRSRLGTFRSRAMQRLGEAKQKSSSKKFIDLLNHIQNVEKEVDRAAGDLLNLYEQYYSKRMRKDTFDRLLPSYKRRLGAALNHLSDQLNLAQREAKLL
jgi:hypothetical protein